ncbi:DUF58 domain-containing protein [Sorangium sp. So ce131]|uniref:DUF58 domain-containing protein n=1 Tax=Sorangium sp. So ce131 TaxID=3133282 RepID=UPI003F619147
MSSTEDRERGSLPAHARSPERSDPVLRSSVRTSRPRRERPPVEQRPLLPARGENASRWTRLLLALRPPRKLKFTREGKYYLGITLGVGFAAINTGNNLLYLLLGMLLSLIVVSGVMSDLSLRHLTVTRRLPARAQVGRAHLVEIEVYNHKKRVPSYAIEVEDLRAGQPADKRCFFLKISPSSAQVAAYRRTPAKRGRDRHTGFRIATRFPFGLFEKSREVEAEGDLIIYPAVDPVRLPVEEAGRREGGASLSGRGGGDETFGLRPMREGDDPRDIYWRKSTMRDQLVLRERTRETRPDVQIVVDTVRPAAEGDGFAQAFERRIREAASRAVAHIKRGDGVVVATTLGERVRGDRTMGSDGILRFLALLEAVDESRIPEIKAERAARASQRKAASSAGPTSGERRASSPRTAS